MSKRFIGRIIAGEEIIVENGYVYARRKFNKHEWARKILARWDTLATDYYVCRNAKTVVAFIACANKKPGIAICHPNDEFNETVGKAIALCRLNGVKIPNEIFE